MDIPPIHRVLELKVVLSETPTNQLYFQAFPMRGTRNHSRTLKRLWALVLEWMKKLWGHAMRNSFDLSRGDKMIKREAEWRRKARLLCPRQGKFSRDVDIGAELHAKDFGSQRWVYWNWHLISGTLYILGHKPGHGRPWYSQSTEV